MSMISDRPRRHIVILIGLGSCSALLLFLVMSQTGMNRRPENQVSSNVNETRQSFAETKGTAQADGQDIGNQASSRQRNARAIATRSILLLDRITKSPLVGFRCRVILDTRGAIELCSNSEGQAEIGFDSLRALSEKFRVEYWNPIRSTIESINYDGIPAAAGELVSLSIPVFSQLSIAISSASDNSQATITVARDENDVEPSEMTRVTGIASTRPTSPESLRCDFQAIALGSELSKTVRIGEVARIGVPFGGRVRVRVMAPRYLTLRGSLELIPGEESTHRIAMTRLMTIRGRLLAEDDAPLAGTAIIIACRVRVPIETYLANGHFSADTEEAVASGAQGEFMGAVFHQSTRSDKDGYFESNVVPSQEILVCARLGSVNVVSGQYPISKDTVGERGFVLRTRAQKQAIATMSLSDARDAILKGVTIEVRQLSNPDEFVYVIPASLIRSDDSGILDVSQLEPGATFLATCRSLGSVSAQFIPTHGGTIRLR